MLNFDNEIKRARIAKEAESNRKFILLFKDRANIFNKEIISKFEKEYHNSVFEEYSKKQISLLQSISASLYNTYVAGNSAFSDPESDGELFVDWRSDIKDIIRDYSCTIIANKIKKHIDNHLEFWMEKVADTSKNIKQNYSFSLEEILEIPNKLKFNASFESKERIEVINSLIPYTNELELTINLLDFFYELSKEIEKVKNVNTLKKEIEGIYNYLETKSNTLLAIRMDYLRNSKFFKDKILQFLQASTNNKLTEKEIIGNVLDDQSLVDFIQEIVHSGEEYKKKVEEKTLFNEAITLFERKKYDSARLKLQQVLELNERRSQANFYLGLERILQNSELNPDSEDPIKEYLDNLKKSINYFKKAEEFLIGETKEYQSKIYAMLIYSELKKIEDSKSKLTLKKLNELYKDSKYARSLSDNFITNFVLARISLMNYQKKYDNKELDIESKKRENKLKEILKYFKESEKQKDLLNTLVSKELIKNFEAYVLYKMYLVSNTIKYKERSKKSIKEVMTDSNKFAHILFSMITDNKREAKNHAITAVEILLDDIEKYKNVDVIKFLLNRYSFYSDNLEKFKGIKVMNLKRRIKRLEERIKI